MNIQKQQQSNTKINIGQIDFKKLNLYKIKKNI